jgi:Tfp pilus assembly pilus retraction ATPase PilT
MNPVLQEKFLKFINIVIEKSITDIHISSGSVPYVRMPSRDVDPIAEF